MPSASVATATAVKPGALRSILQRVANVLQHLLERGPAPGVARRFLDQPDVAELEARGARRLLRTFTARDTVGDRHPQMAGELLRQLFVLTAPPHRQLHASFSPVRLRMPAMAADSCVQRVRAAARCFRPAAVSW